MPIVLGADLGTTKLTALALDTTGGVILARATAANTADITSPADKARGRSEWDVRAIAGLACACLRTVAGQLGDRRRELAGIGITGQQHGVVLLDDQLTPLTPLINWQDRRGEEPHPVGTQTFVQRAVELTGKEAPSRAGCRLAAGYLAVTLFWLK